MDVNAESVPGSGGFNYNGALLDFTEAVCSGIHCPPYTAGHELPCRVHQMNPENMAIYIMTMRIEYRDYR